MRYIPPKIITLQEKRESEMIVKHVYLSALFVVTALILGMAINHSTNLSKAVASDDITDLTLEDEPKPMNDYITDFSKPAVQVNPGQTVNIDITKYANSYFLNLKENGGVVHATGIYGIDWTTLIRLTPSLITNDLSQPATVHDGTVVYGSKITSTVDVYKGGRIEYAVVEKGGSLHLYEGAVVEGLQVYGTLMIDDGVVFLKDNNVNEIIVYEGASVICTGGQVYEYRRR